MNGSHFTIGWMYFFYYLALVLCLAHVFVRCALRMQRKKLVHISRRDVDGENESASEQKQS